MDINNIDYRIQQNQETPLPHLHDQEMNLKTKENMLYEYQYEKSILNSKELIDINEKIKNLKDELIRHKNLFKEESNILGNIISLMEERNSILMKNAEYLKSIIESYKDGTKESSNLINNSVSYLNNAEVNEEKIKLTETQEKLKVQTICCDGNQTFPDKWQMLENKINNPSNQTSESCSVVCNFSVNVGTQKQTTDAPKINEIESFIPKTNAQRQKEFRERKKLSRQGASFRRQIKTGAQRSKEYRERLKRKQLENEIPRKRTKVSKVQNQNDVIHESQIAGPSKLDVLYIDTNNRSTENNNAIDKHVVVKEEVDTYDDIDNEEIKDAEVNDANIDVIENFVTIPIYSNYYQHSKAHLDFINNFKKASFGYSCVVCDRLWWKNDLKTSNKKHEQILKEIIPNYVIGTNVEICSTCKKALDKNKIPLLSTYNGFGFPNIPSHLPVLDIISQRLLSPRIPFIQIRRLRHVHGQYGIYGQIINIPVSVNTMVHQLPRSIDDDHCFYVHIKKKLIHKPNVHQLINKQEIKEWLTYLVKTPLYIHHNITIDDDFFNDDEVYSDFNIDDISEHIPMEDNFIAQQQTLLWNEDTFLHITPGENNGSLSILFDEYAEELSFPTIYGGQFRQYRENVHVTPLMQASSELRRTDRRGADPQHLLYLATKIMRLRVKDSITIGLKHIGSDTTITKEQIQDDKYINSCIETNLAFLRCIPNSAWFWSERKKDLFATMRQKGPPTAFMSLSANETGWNDLLKLLYKLKNNGTEISEMELSKMSYVHKAQLVNEDAVTCVIYFSRLVNTLLHILQSKTRSPFGKYRVLHYFERIEFQHNGSPHAHILLWLDNSPNNLSNNNVEVIRMVDELISVSESEASGNIKLQTHKHNFNCYQKMDPIRKQNCRFGAPFMPSRETIMLFPMKETDVDYSKEDIKKLKNHFMILRENLENFDYTDFNDFYSCNNIDSDEHYHKIIRAGINRPKLFYKRSPPEKWYNPFNPFIFHHLMSNMDFQIIQDEYACATYLVEYVSKSNRCISDLQQKIIELMEENPEFDIAEITRKMSGDILHSVEMSAQEAAWYLLRTPMAKSTLATVYIPTVWPVERQKLRKTMKELEHMDNNCTDIWRENWFDNYEKRPEQLDQVNLAHFVSSYFMNTKGEYVKRKEPKIIRYRNYDMTEHFNDYRREMVLLYIPFRNEEKDVLAEDKFIQIYEDNKDTIIQRRKEFESNFDIEKTMKICSQLYRDTGNNDEEEPNVVKSNFETEPCENLLQDIGSHINADIQNAALGAGTKRRENIMDNELFYELMKRMCE